LRSAGRGADGVLGIGFELGLIFWGRRGEVFA